MFQGPSTEIILMHLQVEFKQAGHIIEEHSFFLGCTPLLYKLQSIDNAEKDFLLLYIMFTLSWYTFHHAKGCKTYRETHICRLAPTHQFYPMLWNVTLTSEHVWPRTDCTPWLSDEPLDGYSAKKVSTSDWHSIAKKTSCCKGARTLLPAQSK